MADNSYPINVYSGLITGEHRKRMGAAIWEYLWLLDHQTTEDGKVLGGAPIKAEVIATDLGESIRRVQEHLQTLENEGYIRRKRIPYGVMITVQRAKKFRARSDENRVLSQETGQNPRSEAENGHNPRSRPDEIRDLLPETGQKARSRPDEIRAETGQNPRSNKDSTEDSTRDIKNNTPARVIAITPEEDKLLRFLQSIPGYPYDLEKDVPTLRSLRQEFPQSDLAAVISDWKAWLMDNKPSKNWRLSLRNWVRIGSMKPKHVGRHNNGYTGSRLSSGADSSGSVYAAAVQRQAQARAQKPCV